jgi:phage terminase large subunit
MKKTTLSPAEFAHFELDETTLYPWQIECLESIGLQEFGGLPMSLVAANGSGKTAKVVALIIVWFFHRFPKGQLVLTSGSYRQIKSQVWPSIKIHARKYKGWRVLTDEMYTEDGGYGQGFSTNDPGKAEGHHPKINNEEDPVFIIVDEAKTVPMGIFEAFERCTRVFQLWTSSPGSPTGDFYESHHTDKALFHAMKVTSFDCPHIDPAKRARNLAKYGADHPLYRSMHLAEFTDLDNKCILSLGVLRNAIDNPPFPQSNGEKCAFFDFAAGGDENVFAYRDGNKVRIIDSWHDKDTVQAVRKFISLARGLGLSAAQCWGDGDGLGAPMVKQFHDEHYFINSFRGNMPPSPVPEGEPREYSNMISEVWILGCNKISKGLIDLQGIDVITQRQLTTRYLEWDNKGCLRAEPKDKMVVRNVKSPDRADALLGAIMCGSHMSGAITAHTVDNMHIEAADIDPGEGVEF